MPDPSRWPTDYRTFAAVVIATLFALGLVEARMSRVSALEIAPTNARVQNLEAEFAMAQKKLDALCRATNAECPLGTR